MALVDWEAVVHGIKRQVRAKASHGQRELTDLITDLEVKHQLEEGLPEKALRLYGDDLHEALVKSKRPSTSGVDGSNGNG